MKRTGIGLCAVLAAAVLWVAAAPVFAGSASWSGRLASPDPAWTRVGVNCTPASANVEWFDAQPFSVDTSGDYAIAMTTMTSSINVDGYFVLYETSFIPTSPQTYCKATNDDGGGGRRPSFTLSLQAGYTYVLVTTQCCVGTGAANEMDYQNIIIGPGNVALLSSATMDIDGNGVVDPLTDGLLLVRWQFGLRGEALIAGALGAGAVRNSSDAVESYLSALDASRPPGPVVVTAAVGGNGGSPYATSCAAEMVAVGLIVNPGTFGGPNVGGLRVLCAPVLFGIVGPLGTASPVGTGAPVTTLAQIGSAIGNPAVTLSCANGAVITGLQGSTTLSLVAVENLTLQCTHLASGTTLLVGPAGAGSTVPFIQTCPAGTAMRGLEGRAGSLVDSMRMRCQ